MANIKFFNLTNHALSVEQIESATNEFGATEFIELPTEFKSVWGQIPADADSEGVKAHISELLAWFKTQANEGDFALIQGDFIATSFAVQTAKELGVTPLAATTRREAVETTDKEGNILKTSVFKHVRFRTYP